jgi:hypothetical protein
MRGVRYHEAAAILEQRPDTLLFSTYEMTGPFPAAVHRPGRPGPEPRCFGPYPMEGLDLSDTLASQGIRLHGTLLPGGGFLSTEEGFRWAGQLIERLDP